MDYCKALKEKVQMDHFTFLCHQIHIMNIDDLQQSLRNSIGGQSEDLLEKEAQHHWILKVS